MSRKNRQPWDKEGLRFECTQCGECCTGTSGLVAFTRREGVAMAKVLGISWDEFSQRYAQPTYEKGVWELLEVEVEGAFDCILLDRCEETGITRCRAHQARPTQCRTWPFWPENLTDKESWWQAGQACEGIGRGRLIPLRVIQQELDDTPDWGIPR